MNPSLKIPSPLFKKKKRNLEREILIFLKWIILTSLTLSSKWIVN